MNKIKDFLEKAAADNAAKKEMTAILGGKSLNEVTDEELEKVCGVAQKLGFDIAAEEIKTFVCSGVKFNNDELAAVVGGSGLSKNESESGETKKLTVEESTSWDILSGEP